MSAFRAKADITSGLRHHGALTICRAIGLVGLWPPNRIASCSNACSGVPGSVGAGEGRGGVGCAKMSLSMASNAAFEPLQVRAVERHAQVARIEPMGVKA